MADPTNGGKRSDLAAVVGAAGLGVVLVAGALAVVMMRETTSDDAVVTSAPVALVAAPESSPVPDGASASPGTDPAGTEPLADEPPPPVSPRFDLVRVDPAGNALIAGQADPLAEVTLALDGASLEVVMADAGGQFVAMLGIAPSDLPRILSLRAVLPDGRAVPGEGTVIVAPFGGEAPVAEVAAVATPTGSSPAPRADRPAEGDAADVRPDGGRDADDANAPDQATGPVAAVTDEAPTVPPRPSNGSDAAALPGTEIGQAPPARAATPGAPPAPTIVLADRDGIRVLQDADVRPEAASDLQLDAISYDTAGAVTLAGRGPASASVRVMLDDLQVLVGEIGPGGRWSLDLPDVDPGTYTLRLEQLAADGTVTDEIRMPFLREDPVRIRDDAMLVADGVSVITVQQGFTLWGIAEANFGEGILYLQIFAENRDAIRDPDLIFPGQIFALPDLPRAAE
jgi:nucleoid-associated protein YgaU